MTNPRDHRDGDDRHGGVETARARTAKGGSAKTKLVEVVVVCSKCARRQGLRPRAVRERLKDAAKRAAREGRLPRKALCIVASGCLGPCPKRAIAVATGASLARGRVRLIDPAADPDAALAALLPGPLLPEFGPIADLAPVGPVESPRPSDSRMPPPFSRPTHRARRP